jgi:predicted  nucleic acid-binding Zn-ribbon protein
MEDNKEKLLDLQDSIAKLKSKTTELKGKLSAVEEQLAEQGIKDPNKADSVIKKLINELQGISDQITKNMDAIEEDYDLGG